VVAHSLSVIGVQAGAARLVLDADPDPTRAREAVASIEATANQAMAEMRRALGILRDTERSGAALAPLPGLGQLPALRDQLRTAGLPVELTVEGTPRPLATQHRPVAVPDRAGSADQRAQARQGDPRRGHGLLRGG
jgi:signal transduction histidine kinase